MKSNILRAVNNITKYSSNELLKMYNGNNRANNMGNALELFVKDAFCDSFNLNEDKAIEEYSKIFSYLGNNSNPPDIILKGGDAIEVKKIDGLNAVALNSSYPKQKLYSNSKMITNSCIHCEDDIGGWNEKDLIYFVGNVDKDKMKSLIIVYGNCYCASDEIYSRIKSKIKSGFENIDNIEFVNTNEIGKLKKIDPLGITDLRIRGMWHIDNPRKVFDYIIDKRYNEKSDMNVFLILKNEKYESFDIEDRNMIEKNIFLNVDNVKIKDPDNPAKLIDAKLISYNL